MAKTFERIRRWFQHWEKLDALWSLFRTIWTALGPVGTVLTATWAVLVGVIPNVIDSTAVSITAGVLLAMTLPVGIGLIISRNIPKVLSQSKTAGVKATEITKPIPKEAPPLSRGEREAVRDMRDLWKDCASLASDKMRYLAINVLGVIEGIHWAERLFRPDIDRMEEATNTMDEMFKHSHITLQDARQKFDAFFAAYAITAGDLYHIDRDHLSLTEPPCTEWYKRWEIANAAFTKGLKSLHNQPEYEGKLKLIVIDNGAREFLKRRRFSSEVSLPPAPSTVDAALVVDALVEQYEYGVHKILNGYTGLSDKYEILGMVEEDSKWVASTIDRMKELGCTTAEISDFNVLGTYKLTPGLHTDPGINNRASQCAVRLERLKRIVAKYDSARPLAPRTEARPDPESEGERPET